MKNFHYRDGARTVAKVDFFLNCLNLLAVGALIYFSIELSISYRDAGYDRSGVLPLMWCTTIIFASVVFIMFCAIRLLYDATRENGEISNALRGVRIWRNLTLVLLILALISTVFSLVQGNIRNLVYTIIGILIRSTMLAFVSMYLNELAECMNEPQLPDFRNSVP